MKKLILSMCMIAGVSMFYSCDSSDDGISGNGDYTYKIRMTDAPGPYDKVNIDIESVTIINGDGTTVTLDTNTGVHDLLELNNGTNIVLASQNLEDDQVQQIKINLGTNNTVVVGGQSYPLTLSGSDTTGLTLNVNQTLDANETNEIMLDFDANASVVATGTNTYKLVPAIRAFDSSVTGSISGNVDNTSLAIVTATSVSSNHFSTSINSAGNFKILGLAPGNYTLTVTPVLPLLPVTQTNLSVQAGQNTTASAIVF
ncbi:MAG: DUF4382 domain-containing protein [Flavobacterium sp.]